jgi:hypothetical protein
MKSEQEIREKLEVLAKELATEGPFTERKNIARIASKRALEWVLEEVGTPIT